MFDQGATSALATLVATDLTVADHDELSVAARSLAQVQAFVDLAKVQISRRTRALADEGDRSSEHVLLDEGRLSGKDSRAVDERERVCTSLPEFESALAGGACTGGHLDSLAQHTKNLSDEEHADLRDVVDDLLDYATNDPVALFDRKAKSIVDRIRSVHRPNSDADELDRQRKRSNVKRWTDRETGMKQTLLSLDPLRDAAVWNVVDHHLKQLRNDDANQGRPFGELQVEAFVAAVSLGSTSSSGARDHRIPEVVVHVDAASLCHGRHEASLCETIDGQPLPVSTVQRLCCEAVLQAVVVAPDGTVDRLGAEQRTANRQQRRMLAAMYPSCAHPHCTVGFSQCRIHHVVWWSRGGATVLANLLPLCESHHHLVHEGGWTLSIDAHRHVTWLRPDGSVWSVDDGPVRTRLPAATAPTNQANGPPAA